MLSNQAHTDFLKARRKAFWQRIRSWFSGKSNALLPFDQVREAIPLQGQRYRGLQTIPIKQIVGSMGRYHEFNRAFLPTEDYTEDRWVNIGKAHYQDVNLPPIEVFKLGDVYFVKDGNHRVSVATQRGIDFIDAYVTEIDIQVRLTTETQITDLETIRETAIFLEKTGLLKMYPDASIKLTLSGEVNRLFEHVDTHRYYLGLNTDTEPSYEDAVRSWYESVYLPLVDEIERQGLNSHYPGLTSTDLYLLVSEYQWLLRGAYEDESSRSSAEQSFMKQLEKISVDAGGPGKRLARSLRNAPWLDEYILDQERIEFVRSTGLDLEATVPGAYTKLLQHIQDHRWYRGIDQNREIPWEESVASWHENVYLPMLVVIEELDILSYVEGRTETDLYLWIIEHQALLSDSLNWEIPLETAAENLLERAKMEPSDMMPSADDVSIYRTSTNPLLFVDILVPFGDDEEDLLALDQALIVAKRNQGRIHGLHVISSRDEQSEEDHSSLTERFETKCRDQGISGKVALVSGKISEVIAERAGWVDLIVLNLNHPPSSGSLKKFRSGFRYLLRRSGRPILAVPGAPTQLRKLLLAYDGSPLADEALYLAACFLAFWEDTELVVLTAGDRAKSSSELLSRAEAFLDYHNASAKFVRAASPADNAILETAEKHGSDLIIVGGYGNAPAVEIAFGSTIDTILQKSTIPVLIRT